MRRTFRAARAWLCIAAPLLLGTLAAQTINISPVNESVGVGLTKQFTAMTMGLSNSAVTWSVAGMPGGNQMAGTIDASGLYTAPAAIPGQNPVQITATSAMTMGVSASTYLSILSLGPPVTGVSPNPVPVGQYTVTVSGTGFAPGAVAWNGGIQLTTQYIGPTQLRATGYQSTTQTGTFRVMNPGSMFGGSLMVPFVGGSSGGGGSAVTVTPPAATLVLGATQQFAASATGGHVERQRRFNHRCRPVRRAYRDARVSLRHDHGYR